MRKYIIKYDTHTYSKFFEKERRYAGTIVHTKDQANTFIHKAISNGDPFLVARFGSGELYAMEVFDLKIKHKFSRAILPLCSNAGFFPNDYQLAHRFSQLMKESCKQVDAFAIWNHFMEERYIRREMKKDVYLTQLRYLEPWFSDNPWTQALEGKKVLVIHPFTDTIKQQYEKRNLLFGDKRILPNFELITVKAVQTIAGEVDERFSTWFDALEYMYNEAMKEDFDIALIGCGAYGFPLAAKIKAAGKQAIHMGGVLQVLFGIKGKRWEDDVVVSALFNEHWCYPNDSETPRRAKNIEGGCYW